MFHSSRLHAYTRKRYAPFYSCCLFKSARMQKIFVFAFLHPWPLLFPPYRRPRSSYRNNMSVCIGITYWKGSREGFGKSPDCGAGSMTAWKYFSETVMCLPSRSQTLPIKWNECEMLLFWKPESGCRNGYWVASICRGTFRAVSHIFHSALCDMGCCLCDTSRSVWIIFGKGSYEQRKNCYSIVNHCVIIERDHLEWVM